MNGRRNFSVIVPVALILLVIIPWLISPGDYRALPLGVVFYAAALLLWFLGRGFSREELTAAAIGAGIGLAITVVALPTIHVVADSPAGRAILSLSLALTTLIVGSGLAIEKARRASSSEGGDGQGDSSAITPKICDTSVLIDGRLADMADAGFLEGDVVIPQFILHELQGIADSSEQLKRNRGRRGLDIVKRLQDIKGITVQILAKDYRDEAMVDHKLIRLAAEMNASLITNDFNLNKVARVRQIKVLNLNDLVNALKTIYLPGEEISVLISREGKESGQGVGYLEDGTMVVVDGGAPHIGHDVRAVVTNIHQTTAGRMIFTRCEGAAARRDQRNGR